MDTVAISARSGRRTIAAGVLAMTAVGSSVGISRTLVHAPLFAAQGIRYAAAAALLLILAKRAHARVVLPRGSEWLWLAGIAAAGLVLFNVAIVRGVAHAEPAVIAVAVACVPVLLGVAGPLLEHRAPHARIVLAALVVTAGSVLVEGTGRADAAGVAWAAVALACECAFTLLAVPVLPRHGAWGVSVHSAWMATIMLIVLSVLTEGPGAVTRLTAADGAAIAYLVVMVTAVAFIAWYSVVAALGAARAGLLTGIAPVAAALTGVAAGSQAPKPLVWLGMLIVMCGLVTGLSARPGRKGRPVRLPETRHRPRRPAARPHQAAAVAVMPAAVAVMPAAVAVMPAARAEEA